MSRRPLAIAIGAVLLVAGLVLAYAWRRNDAPSVPAGPPSADGLYQATLRSLRPGGGGKTTTVFAVGETVRVEMSLTNVSGQVRKEPRSVLNWYLDVHRADGTLVRAEQRQAMATDAIPIQPGLPYVSQHDWGQMDAHGVPVGSGAYVLTAVSVAGRVSVPITIAPGPVSRP